MRNQCGCERGENCTKTTVCANEIVVEDLQAEIERLTAPEKLMKKAAKQILALETERKIQDNFIDNCNLRIKRLEHDIEAAHQEIISLGGYDRSEEQDDEKS